jgi:hypothetical protein
MITYFISCRVKRHYPVVSLLLLLGLAEFCFQVNFLAADASSHRDHAWPDEDLLARSRQIDHFVSERLRKEGIQAQAPAPESVLLRRVYLDLIGRIPSTIEARTYLNNPDPNKLENLTDALLASEGHVSHEFNYWADLLRIKSRMRNLPGQPYIQWIQQALRDKLPYDRFVRELINAEGYLWENGATGFYFRDAGMALDHMANTFQVFLGTQVVCAQCHDHPYDAWTQKQYYQQAAFTHGIKTNDPKMTRRFRALGNKNGDKEISPTLKAAARRMVRPLRYRVFETGSKLKLPTDYQYTDDSPGSKVVPHAMFGHADVFSGENSLRTAYAEWMTGAENPRFAKTIANRYWKRLMGLGLIEPVDDLKDGVQASHPELMKFLSDTMVEIKFDLPLFQAILCRTDTYRRATLTRELTPEQPFLFDGRPLVRMRAEQVWDSVMTLIVTDLDNRPGKIRSDRNYAIAQQLRNKPLDQVLKLVERELSLDQSMRETQGEIKKIQRRIRSSDRSKRSKPSGSLRLQLAEKRLKLKTLRSQSMLANSVPPSKSANQWSPLPAQLVRASRVGSPAPEGHFLREFGQSDRETIDAFSIGANVPQVLALLNGPVMEYLASENGALARQLKLASSSKEKLRTLFISFLTRLPSPEEERWLLSEQRDEEFGFMEKVSWMLLNAREFSFIQ